MEIDWSYVGRAFAFALGMLAFLVAFDRLICLLGWLLSGRQRWPSGILPFLWVMAMFILVPTAARTMDFALPLAFLVVSMIAAAPFIWRVYRINSEYKSRQVLEEPEEDVEK